MEKRVIKFRAWDDGKMYYQSDKDEFIIYNMERLFGRIKGDAILMQFTGLESKKKQSLYEGDICTKMISPDENNRAPRELYRGVIVFHYGGFCLKVGKYYYPLFRQHGVIEAIGNIMEHPHLLIKTER